MRLGRELIAFVLSYLVYTTVLSISQVVVGMLNNYELISFNFLWFGYFKENGENKIRICEFKLGCECGMLKKNNATKVNYYISELLPAIIPVILSIIYIIVLFKKSLIESLFLCSIGICFFIYDIISIVIYIKSLTLIFGKSSKAIFARETKEKFDLLKKGVTPGKLVFSTIDIPDDKNTKIYVQRYELFRFCNYLDNEEFSSLKTPIENIERNLPEEFSVFNTSYIYELIFYYSAFDRNEEKASYYYNIVSKNLVKDKDCNGLRVYAYYKYYIEKDSRAAKEFALEGLSVVSKFNIEGLKEFEKKLLLRLIEIIDENEDYNLQNI